MSRFRHISYETCQRLPFVSSMIATILSGVLLVLDVIHHSHGLDEVKIIYEIVVVTVGFFLVFCFSWILRFCWYQLIGILYTYVFMVCLWLGRYGVFGEYLVHCHVGLFAVGMIYSGAVVSFLIMRKKGDDDEEG